MENLHLIFNKTMYDGIGIKAGKVCNDNDTGLQTIVNSKLYESGLRNDVDVSKQTFLLKTVYPGMLIGTGYAHGISDDTDVKIGFNFDYVTGQPYIPGSSVKGVIRSVFDNNNIVSEILENNGIDLSQEEDNRKIISSIKKDIFENGDVFLDAVLKRGDSSGKVMTYDYITPHPDPVKNPTPLKILKVLPDVVFEFRFILKDSEFDGIKITASKKISLFRNILLDFGIGAKTNVGYGNLIDVKDEELFYPEYIESNKSVSPEKYSDNNRTEVKLGSKSRNNQNSDGKKCPNCGKWNFRFKKDTTEESYCWKQGICFSCKKSLELN